MNVSLTIFSSPSKPSPSEIIPGKGVSTQTTTTACTRLRNLGCVGILQKQTMRLPKNYLFQHLNPNLIALPTGKAWCPGHGGFVPIMELEADHFQPACTSGTEVNLFNQKVKVTADAVEDIANKWLLCRSCNGAKSSSDPIQNLQNSKDFGEKFLQSIRMPAKKAGIKSSLLAHEISKECTLTYREKIWNIVSIDDSEERVKVTAKCDQQEILMAIRLWKDDQAVTISPEINVSNLSIQFEHETSQSKNTQENQPLREYTHAKSHLNIRLKHSKDPIYWDAEISNGEISGETSLGLPFRISLNNTKKHSITYATIEDPNNVIVVNIPEMYCRNQYGVLCDKDGKKLGQVASTYSEKTHADKIEQKKAVEVDISFPLDNQINEANLAVYEKGKEDLEARRKLRSVEKKIATVKKTVAESDTFQSDSDNDLTAEQKKSAFEAALSKFPTTLKKWYREEKQKQKNLPA
jgi:hypothetical protein